MRRRRYETDLDKVQQQAVERARAGLHPDVVQARERRPSNPPPMEPTGGVRAPDEVPVGRRAPTGGGLQRLLDQRGVSDRIMRQPARRPVGQPGMRKLILDELKRRRLAI